MPDAIDPNTVTISKADLATYQRGLALLQKLEGNSETRPMLESAIKKVIPEIETESDKVAAAVKPHLEPVLDGLKKVTERFEAEDKAREEREQREAEAKLDRTFADLKTQGYTDDGIEKIKALMVTNHIADPYAAAALFDKQNPPAAVDVSGYQPQTWDLGAGHGAGANLDELFKDPDAWADKQVGVVLAEERARRAA